LDDVADDQWTTAELLRRVDAGKAWLDGRLAEFPTEADFEEPVGGGWTRRQMVHHLAVWHGLTASRLRSYQQTGQRAAPIDSDAINADAMKSAEGRSRQQLLAELDSSFAQLRTEVAGLRDDQLSEHDFWPGGVVVGNTFGHYEEHRADLAR
jgi:hypothetical protein